MNESTFRVYFCRSQTNLPEERCDPEEDTIPLELTEGDDGTKDDEVVEATTSRSLSPTLSRTSKSGATKRYYAEDDEVKAKKRMEILEEINERQRREEDDVDYFFRSIAKMKVLSVVTEMQLQSLSNITNISHINHPTQLLEKSSNAILQSYPSSYSSLPSQDIFDNSQNINYSRDTLPTPSVIHLPHHH